MLSVCSVCVCEISSQPSPKWRDLELQMYKRYMAMFMWCGPIPFGSWRVLMKFTMNFLYKNETDYYFSKNDKHIYIYVPVLRIKDYEKNPWVEKSMWMRHQGIKHRVAIYTKMETCLQLLSQP